MNKKIKNNTKKVEKKEQDAFSMNYSGEGSLCSDGNCDTDASA